jgi:hypothetical protein
MGLSERLRAGVWNGVRGPQHGLALRKWLRDCIIAVLSRGAGQTGGGVAE